MLQAPGSYWEYNDVRINQLSLALLHLFRRPLQDVFLETVLRPLGGGDGFAAGVLHAERTGGDADAMARTGLALAALKHSLPGDASLFRQAHLDAYLKGGLDVRR